MVGNRWMLVAVVLLAVPLVACGQETAEAGHEPPAVVEPVEGQAVSRITLSQRAAERLGIETDPVQEATADGQQTTIPYGAVLYDAEGVTWAYTSPEPLVFVREEIVVDRIDGDRALLSKGPPSGTPVVTVGAAELWGVETGVGGSGH
jgi:hypothetical protein